MQPPSHPNTTQFTALHDRTSPYSLHYHLHRLSPGLVPDLRPRLYFAPGLVRGAVSTGLHLDGLGHMQSDHWFLRFTDDSPGDDAVNLVQVYPSEALLGEARWAVLREVAGAAMSPAGLKLPHAVPHDVNASLKVGCDESVALHERASIEPLRSVQLKSGELLRASHTRSKSGPPRPSADARRS